MKNFAPVWLALLLLLLLAPAPKARAADKIWSAVILASNTSTPSQPPPQLESVYARLKSFFKYNQFEILGSTTTSIADQDERWLVPTDHFWVNVKARRASAKEARGGFLLNLQLFHDKRQLVETEAKLAPDSPLIIRGPLHARGQVLIVLMVQP